MLKRISLVGGGVMLGLGVAVLASHLALLWGLVPDRDLQRNTDSFREALAIVHENYVDADHASYDGLTEVALKGMVQSLDAHSEFLTATGWRELQEEIKSEFGGIGVQVELRDGKVVVIAPIPNTPGERAGIQRGDEIVRVDGTPIAKLGMEEVVKLLRGKPGTKVAITLYRPALKRNVELTLVREIIKVASVQGARMLPGGIGYIEINEFSQRTGDEFHAALAGLEKENLRGLIIDLRDNPGGLLNAAVAVAGPFFKQGELVVYTQGRTADSREDYDAGGGDKVGPLPLAVLINAGSASAAEIVAGALKDTGRAVIVGERSFGKGSVQSIFQLKGGRGLRLTTAKYYTPGGVSIQAKGIAPEVPVVLSADDDSKLRLQRLRFDLTDPREFAARFGFSPIPDPQLQAAEDVLRGVNLYDRRAVAVSAAAR